MAKPMCELPQEVQNGLAELEEHYTEFQENKRGKNGFLFFAKNRVTEQEVAIKFYAGEEGIHQHDEPRQLAAINSPNVLPILDARIVEQEWGYFITPRCHEGDLDDLITTSPSAHFALDTAIGICNGVSELHAARMLHRDLKPGNIVIDSGRPRIADFGSVKALAEGDDSTNASRHSILYRPPESFASNQYSIKGDVYQVGLLVYQLLGGDLPYDGIEYLNRNDLREYNRIGDPIDKSIFVDSVIKRRAETGTLVNFSTLPPWVSTSAKRHLKSIIYSDKENRLPTIAEVAAVLTQVRATILNWQYIEDVITLHKPNSTIQIRQCRDGEYAAFKRNNGGVFRRMPRLKSPQMSKLINRIQ